MKSGHTVEASVPSGKGKNNSEGLETNHPFSLCPNAGELMPAATSASHRRTTCVAVRNQSIWWTRFSNSE
eukprot:3465428-Pyramimonas_sp.AAC.1